MKQYILYSIVAFIALLFLTSSPASAEGTANSSVDMIVPELAKNQASTISTTISSTLTTPFSGNVDYYAFDNTVVLGTEGTSSLTSINPSIVFSLDETKSISAIQIPVDSIEGIDSMGIKLNYQIDTIDDMNLMTGSINKYSMYEMNVNGYLLLIFNSTQTSTISVSISADDEYRLTFIDPTEELTINFKSSSQTTTEFYDGSTNTGNSVSLIFHESQKLGTKEVSSGNADFNFTPSYVFEQILALYYDVSYFETSFDLDFVSFNTTGSYTILASDQELEQGTTGNIQVYLQNSGIGVANAEVQFLLFRSSYYTNLGTLTTGSSGSVTMIYTAEETPGEYQILITSEVSSTSISEIINLTITPPTLNVIGLEAKGYYGSSVGNSTNYKISGFIENTIGQGVNNIPIELIENDNVLFSTQTTSNGYFEFNNNQNISIGLYNDIFLLDSNTTEYNFNSIFIDLNILKGLPIIQLESTNYSLTYSEPFNILGNITDNSGDLINAELIIQFYNNSQWQTIHSFSTNGLFSEFIPSNYTGQFVFRVISPSNSFYSASSFNFNVNIGKLNASLSTDLDLYEIEYKGNTTVTVSLNSNISEETYLEIFAQSPLNTTLFLNVTSGSTASKSFTFTFTPFIEYSLTPFFNFSFLITSSSPIYNIQSIFANFKILPTSIETNLIQNTFTIKENANIQIELWDQNGNNMDDNHQFNLEIDQINVQISSLSGLIGINHIFAAPGEYTLVVDYDPENIFPYNEHYMEYTITVLKGSLQLEIIDQALNQGETAIISSDLIDHVGDSTDASIKLEYYNITTNLWSELITLSTSNGLYYYEIYLDQNYGRTNHNFRLSIAESTLYNQYSSTFTITVVKTQTNLVFDAPLSISYNSDLETREITISVSTFFSTPLSGTNLTVYVNLNSVTTLVTLDSLGDGIYVIPNQLSPGQYIIYIEFQGNQFYLNSNNSQNLEVTGTPTIVEWVSQPSDTYYGDFMEIQFRVYDATNTDISGMNIRIRINDAQVAIGVTNASGYVKFNLHMLFSAESLEIDIIVDPKDGWQGNSFSFDVIQHHRILDGMVDLSNNGNYTNFGDNVNIKIFTHSDVSSLLGRVTISVYVIDPNTSERVYVGRYFTNTTGWVELSLDLPNYSVLDDYLLEFDLSKQYYQSFTLQKAIDIISIDYSYEIEVETSGFLEQTEISIHLSGVSIQDTIITFTVIDEIHNIEINQTYSTNPIIFLFIPQKAGDVTIGITIFDPSSNYNTLITNTVLTVSKATPEITTNQIDVNGQAFLNTTITVNDFPVYGMVEVSYDQINYMVVIDGSLLISIDQITPINLIVQSSQNLNEVDIIVDIIQSSPMIEILTDTLYTQQINILEVSIVGNEDLNNHLMELYIIIEGNEYLISQTYSQHSIVEFVIDYDFPLGQSTLKIVYPEQSYYLSTVVTQNYVVGKVQLEFELDHSTFIGSQQVQINFTSTLPHGFPINQNYMLYLGGTQISVGILQEELSLVVTIPSLLGNYDLQLVINETEVSELYNNNWEVTILQATSIEVVDRQITGYGDDNRVVLRLYSPETNTGIGGQDVTIFKCGFFCSVSSNQIGIYVTNSTGHLIFTIPSEFEPNVYQFYAYYNFDDNQLAASDLEFSAQVMPEETEIRFGILDNGITNNITLNLGVYDEGGLMNIPGTIIFNFNGTEFIFEYNGITIELIYYELLSNYSIYVTFEPDSDYYLPSYNSDTIGWSKINPEDISVNSSSIFGYYESMDLFINVNDVGLDGLDLHLSVDGQLYQVVTLESGKIPLLMDLPPGNYIITLVINDNKWLNGVWSFDFSVEVELGNVDFDFSVNSTTYGSPISVQMDDIMTNSTYRITLETIGFVIDYTTQTKFYDITTDLPVGNYSITILRMHEYLHDKIVEQWIEIRPIRATLSIQQEGGILQFQLNPSEDTNDFYFILYLSNDTNQFEFLLSSLSMEFNLSTGIYLYEYILYGTYTGEGDGLLEINTTGHTDDDNGVSNSFDLPNLDANTTVGLIIGSVMVASSVFTRVRSKSQI